MQKKIFAAVLLSALLLTVGCAEDGELSAESFSAQSTVSVTSDESAQTSSTVLSLPEETTVEESSAESSGDVISLPSSSAFALYGKLLFCPDGGWEETEEHVYTSADGAQSVRADLLTLPDPKGITESLLVEDAVQTLPDAVAQTGAEILSLESVVLNFLGTEHSAVSLVTKKDGKTVWQYQLYLQDGETVLLLTVRAQEQDDRESVLSYFEHKTED